MREENVFRVWEAAVRVWMEMAPYLLLGFAIAGVLSVWISAGWVRRHLGGGGWKASARAALFGVPLPLCSCSVIPVSASLRGHGASPGGTASFLMATPQVGVQSLVVSYGLLGPVITFVRAAVAFVSGWLCGTLVDALPPGGTPPDVSDDESGTSPMPAWWRALRHGFVVLPRSLAVPLLLGVSVSALLGGLLPPDALAGRLSPGWPAMLLMLVVGIPLYVCSTSSIPVAIALIHAGVPEGAALVFLISGPATNAATLAALGRMLGLRATAVYLVVLSASALLAGWVLDTFLRMGSIAGVPCTLAHEATGPWARVAGIALLALLAPPLLRRFRPRSRASCSSGTGGAFSPGKDAA